MIISRFLKRIPSNFLITARTIGNLAGKRVQKIETRPNASTKVFDYLLSKKIEPTTNWQGVREELISNIREVTPVNVDALTLHYFASVKEYDHAFHFIDFLKKENKPLNLAIMGSYFKIFYHLFNENKLTEEQSSEILEMYKELKQSYKVLDPKTNECLILALSVTNNWRECLNLLNNIKITANASNAAYNAIVCASFRNKDYELGFKLFEEMLALNRTPSDIVYQTYFHSLISLNDLETTQKLDELFEFLNVFDVRFKDSAVTVIKNGFTSCGYDVKETNILKSGNCIWCKQKLEDSAISEDEFNALKQHFLEKVIIGKNIFCKTSPTELETFKNFIDKMEKFDVVIDGLNVAYSAGKNPPRVLGNLVLAVVEHFKKKQESVLVLGRKHMIRWPSWSLITRKAATFLTENISQDDPFLLYCALVSGKNTKLISRDMMRSHLFLLKDYYYKMLFNKWLFRSRFELLHVNTEGRVFLKYPPSYNIAIQKNADAWHIPYEDSANEIKWLCIRKLSTDKQ